MIKKFLTIFAIFMCLSNVVSAKPIDILKNAVGKIESKIVIENKSDILQQCKIKKATNVLIDCTIFDDTSLIERYENFLNEFIKITGSFTTVNFENKNRFLTNAHVCSEFNNNEYVEQIKSLTQTQQFAIDDQNYDFNLSIKTFISTSNGNEYSIKSIKKIDEKNDLCEFELDQNKPKLVGLQLQDEVPNFGEKVFNICAPFGKLSDDFVFYSEGFFVGYGEIVNIPALLVNMKIYSGCSGSGAILENGNLFGIVFGHSKKIKTLSYIIGPKTIYSFLK